jgi:uncharacterized membrane protein
MTRPERPWNVRRLTERQQGVLEWARLHGEVRPRELRRAHGYSCPTEALNKLVDRGLLVRTRRGRYAPVVPPQEVAA